MKYYYTDPLIAAYMMRAFNVGIGTPNYHNPEKRRKQSYASLCNHAINNTEDKYYVHPDSYSIFKPIEGDCVYHLDFGYGSIHEFEVECGEPYTIGMDSEAHFLTGGAIIQRNGKQFFMPEVE